jgi:hypothetical protein
MCCVIYSGSACHKIQMVCANTCLLDLFAIIARENDQETMKFYVTAQGQQLSMDSMSFMYIRGCTRNGAVEVQCNNCTSGVVI